MSYVGVACRSHGATALRRIRAHGREIRSPVAIGVGATLDQRGLVGGIVVDDQMASGRRERGIDGVQELRNDSRCRRWRWPITRCRLRPPDGVAAPRPGIAVHAPAVGAAHGVVDPVGFAVQRPRAQTAPSGLHADEEDVAQRGRGHHGPTRMNVSSPMTLRNSRATSRFCRPRYAATIASGARARTLPAARRHDHPVRDRPPARDPDPHLHRVDRCPPRLPRGRSRRLLRREHRGLLSLHTPRRRWRRLTGAFHGVAGVDVPGVPPPGIWLGYVYPTAPRTVAGAGCGEPDAQ